VVGLTTTLCGDFLFKEQRILERLTGAVIMLVGMLLIALA